MKRTILLVEDEVLFALEEERTIRGFGYDVIVKQGGDEAIEAAAGDAVIDLVLMDVDLGGGTSGPEAARRILERRTVPVVFLAFRADREMVEQIRGILHYGLVVKNSGDFLLRSTIETAIGLFEAGEKTRENLQFSEEKFLKSFMVSPAALCIARLKDYKIIEINDTLVKRTGFTREELIDKTAPELFIWDDPADRQEVQQALLTKGEITGKEYAFRMKDRSIVIGEYSAFIITIAGEKHILVTIVDITERKRAEERIRALLEEKDLLLREVHHRIKNNMNTMISLLSLQAGMLNEQATINALLEARGRIQSMSVLYDTLYQSENVSEMSIEYYLAPLVERIVSLFPVSAAVTIDRRIENFQLKVKTLLPLGIIANELVTNAMKYAFTGRENGVITVSASKQGTHASLVIEDNGNGLPETVNLEQSTGFGLRLVGILVKQIGGDIRIERPGGARFVITFPLPS